MGQCFVWLYFIGGLKEFGRDWGTTCVVISPSIINSEPVLIEIRIKSCPIESLISYYLNRRVIYLFIF